MTDTEAFVAAYMAACKEYPKVSCAMGFARDLWQAAIKHEREAAAQVCLYPPKMEFASGYLAAAIRTRGE